tara:strand:+ start:334 stop:636 length:303 start_codon:yes stop_codon:yes gene_type:complete
MLPKEKTFREIIELEDQIEQLKDRIDELKDKAIVYKWASLEAITRTYQPDKKWWQENQPELYKEMIKHYIAKTGTRFSDKGYKLKLRKQVAAENKEKANT